MKWVRVALLTTGLLSVMGCTMVITPMPPEQTPAAEIASVGPTEAASTVYPLAVSPGTWLAYRVITATAFQITPGVLLEANDEVRFEVVGATSGTKMGLDMVTQVSYEVPLVDVFVNDEQVATAVGEPGTIGVTMIFPVAEGFWQDYQAVEENWNTVTASEGLPYHGEIRTEDGLTVVEFGYTEPTVLEIQGRDGPVKMPIERGVTVIRVDPATGVVVQQTRDASGGQAAYDMTLTDSSVETAR